MKYSAHTRALLACAIVALPLLVCGPARAVYQTVNVGTMPGVQVTGTPNVNVVNTPAVNVNNTPGVTVQNTPGVTVQNTPGVTVQNTPAVTVNNTPGVTVQNTPSVTIANSPSVFTYGQGCNNQGLASTKVATVSSGGTAGFYQIIPAVNGQTITICSFLISGQATASGSTAILGGTGTNCGTTVSNNTGVIFIGTVPMFVSFGTGLAPATTSFTVSNAACLDAVGTAPNITLLVVYEQH